MGVAIFFALVILNAAKTLQTVWTPSFALTVSERSLLQSAQQSTCGSTLHYCSFLRGDESVHVTMPKNVYLCGIRRLYLRAAYCRQHNNKSRGDLSRHAAQQSTLGSHHGLLWPCQEAICRYSHGPALTAQQLS